MATNETFLPNLIVTQRKVKNTSSAVTHTWFWSLKQSDFGIWNTTLIGKKWKLRRKWSWKYPFNLKMNVHMIYSIIHAGFAVLKYNGEAESASWLSWQWHSLSLWQELLCKTLLNPGVQSNKWWETGKKKKEKKTYSLACSVGFLHSYGLVMPNSLKL